MFAARHSHATIRCNVGGLSRFAGISIPRVLPVCLSTASSSADLTLYERSSDNYTLMRTGVAFSSFHTLYWFWYINDFIPAVNASPITELHIDPSLGVAGFVFALAVQTIFFLYPKRLVSKMALRDNRELVIWTHSLPWIRPSTKSTVVPLGQLLLDPNSSELQTVLNECEGDLSLFRGVLGVGRRWPPYLMDIRDATNVPHHEELLCALLYPEKLQRQTRSAKRASPAIPISRKNPTKESKLRRITRRRN